jgi:hypothetical protein
LYTCAGLGAMGMGMVIVMYILVVARDYELLMACIF